MSFDTEVELMTAECELRVAYKIFYGTPSPLDRIGAAGKVLRAEARMKEVCRRHRDDGQRLVLERLVELAELTESLVNGAILCAVKQSRANFLAREASDSGDGWTWPVQAMRVGWAHGGVAGPDGVLQAIPHYFPAEIAAQVAEAADGARFRRRHPPTGDGGDSPELTAGWVSEARVQGSAVHATVNLLKSEEDIRSTLLAAQEANKLDLFSVSIMAYFGFKKSQVEGRPALVATSLQRFLGLDMCAEPGAGGRFLAAS